MYITVPLPVISGSAELAVVQMSVVSVFSQQLFVRTLLDDAAISHYEDMVGIFYC